MRPLASTEDTAGAGGANARPSHRRSNSLASSVLFALVAWATRPVTLVASLAAFGQAVTNCLLRESSLSLMKPFDRSRPRVGRCRALLAIGWVERRLAQRGRGVLLPLAVRLATREPRVVAEVPWIARAHAFGVAACF